MLKIIIIVLVIVLLLLYLYYIKFNKRCYIVGDNVVNSVNSVNNHNDVYNNVYGNVNNHNDVVNSVYNNVNENVNHNNIVNFNNDALFGGLEETVEENDGATSCCVIDEENNTFTKYYVESKDYKEIHYECPIKDVVLKTKKTNEYENAKYITQNVKNVDFPTFYFKECGTVEWDDAKFDKIKIKDIYDKDNVLMKKIVMSYVKADSFRDYICDEKRTLDELISAFKNFFKALLKLIHYNIIPYDTISNSTNALIKDGKIIMIDFERYHIITERPKKLKDEDIFMYFAYMETIKRRPKMEKHSFYPIHQRDDKEQIIGKSLKGLIKDEYINIMINDFCNQDRAMDTMKTNRFVNNMMRDNSARYVNIRELLNLYVFNKNKFEEIKNKVSKMLNENDIKNFNEFDFQRFKIYYNIVHDKLSGIQYLMACSLITKIDFRNILLFISFHLNKSVKKTLYYNKYSLIGYEKKFDNNMLTIETENYIPLIQFLNTQSVHGEYTSREIDPDGLINSVHRTKVKFEPRQYIICDELIKRKLI